MTGFQYFLASFALTALTTAYQYIAEEKKQDRLEKLEQDRLALETKRANLLDEESKRKGRAIARFKIGELVNRAAAQGLDPENRFSRGNIQAVESSLKGAETFLAETSGVAAELRTSASDILSEEREPTLGLASSLAVAGGAAGASVFGVQAAKGKWGDVSTWLGS